MAKKKKQKKIIKKIFVKEKDNYDQRIKEEVKSLEAKRNQLGSGFRNKLKKMALTKQINDKMRYFQTKDKTRSITASTDMINRQVELENARNRLNEARRKSQVNFEGFGFNNSPRQLKGEDIFK